MPLVTSAQMLLDAQKGHYAVGAFNVENMEMAKAIIGAAEELQAPVMLQTTPSTVKYAGLNLYYAMVSTLAAKANVPVALHLDHGETFALAMQAIRAGYTSIMIDGSHGTFEENISITSRVVEVAKASDIPVEGELGKVGGKEDDLDGGSGSAYTDPDQAAEFAQRTGVSSLAIAIGTAHGLYAGTPKLDISRIGEIRKKTDTPLVLHGASGLADDAIQACIDQGICKVNFATELRIAYSDAVKQVLAQNPETFDPKKYGTAAILAVKEIVKNRMQVCRSQNKA